MEKNIYELFKKIGLSASIAMIVSLLINMIAKAMVIKIAALAIIFVAVCLFLFFKKKQQLLIIAIPSLIGIVAAMLLPEKYTLLVIVSIAGFILLDKLSLLLKLALFIGLSLLINAIIGNLIIRIAILAVLFILVAIPAIKNKDKYFVLSLISMLLSIVLSIVLSANLSLSIVACLVSFAIVTKVPSNFKPVAFAILFTTLLTWILPISYYSGELATESKTELGLFDLFNYPSVVMSYFGNYFIYLLVIGGFYGVLYKTGVFSGIISNIAAKSKGKEKLVVAFLICFIAALVAVCGVSFGILMIVPFVIALILSMGYDKITAAMVSAGSISVGLMGNLFSSTYIATDYNLTSQNGAGIINSMLNTAQTDLWIPKLVILLLGIALLIFTTVMHMSKSTVPSKEELEEYAPNTKKEKSSAKIWPFVLVFDLTFIVMLLAFTSWTSVFKVKVFSNVTNYLLNTVNISGYPIIGKLLGGIKEFEQWGLVELSTLLVLSSFVIALIYKVKFSDFIDSFVKGAKKAFKPAVLVSLIFTVLVIVSYNPITLTIIKPIITMTAKFNVFTASLSAFVASIFNVDIYYIASNCLQYTTSVFSSSPKASVAMIWYSMYGFASLVAPTSVTLIAVLSYLNIPYKKWLKSNWIFILGTLLMMMVVFTVTVMISK